MRKLLFLSLLFIILIGCGSEVNEVNESADEDYGQDLKSVIDEIISTSVKVEEITNVYAELWGKSIEKDYLNVEDVQDALQIKRTDVTFYFDVKYGDYSTDGDYISSYGNFSSTIAQLNSYYNEIGTIEEIKTTSDEIENLMKQLNTPTEDYEKVYDSAVELYTNFKQYTDLAINPSGSLVSFNESRTKLSQDILNLYNEIEVLMPNDKK